jgi:hypothetical protein
LKSYASAHASVIQPLQALEKCLQWLLIHAVVVLVACRREIVTTDASGRV